MSINIIAFTIGHSLNLPDIQKYDEIQKNLPIKVKQIDYYPNEFAYNNAVINKKSMPLYYGEIDAKSNINQNLNFFKLRNRQDLQKTIKEILNHENIMYETLYLEKFGNEFSQKLKESDIAYIDVQQYDQSQGKQGYRSKFPQILQIIRSNLKDCKYIIWPEILRPLFHTFSLSQYQENQSFAKNINNGPYLYLEGNINMTFSVPHGGKNIYETDNSSFFNIICTPCNKEPSHYRSIGCEQCKDDKIVTCLDTNTAELALIIYKQFVDDLKQSYKQDYLPHMLISLTSRQQVELNREDCMDSKCQSKVITELKWIYENYHKLLGNIVQINKKIYKNQLLIDLHGLNSTKKYTQLGYCMRRKKYLQLYETNKMEQKNINILSKGIQEQSSIQNLAKKYQNKNEIISLIFGNMSLGHFLNENNIQCIPSDLLNFNNCDEFTQDNTLYFEGGYITKNYSSIQYCDAIQIELNKETRCDRKNFKQNGNNISIAVFKFYRQFYSI